MNLPLNCSIVVPFTFTHEYGGRPRKIEDSHETARNHEANKWRNFSGYGSLHIVVDLDPLLEHCLGLFIDVCQWSLLA